MTIHSSVFRTDWLAADGVNKNWSYTFSLAEDAVIIEVRDASDNVAVFVDNFGFFATDEDEGFIQYPAVGAALAVGNDVRISRLVDYTQLTEIGNQGRFLPNIHEKAFDRATIQIQQLKHFSDRSPKTPDGEIAGEWIKGDENDIVGFALDGGAKPLGRSLADILGIEAGAAAEILSRIAGDLALASLIGQFGAIDVAFFDSQTAAALANIGATKLVLLTGGRVLAGDGGAAHYKRLSKIDIDAAATPAVAFFRSVDRFMPDGSTDATNGGYWILAETRIDLRMLGAGHGVTVDDTAAYLAAIVLADGNDAVAILVPPTTITINQTLDINLGRFDMIGFGRGVSTVVSAVEGLPLFRVTGSVLDMQISDFEVLGNGVTGALGNGHAFAFWDTDVDVGSAVPQGVVFERLTVQDFRGTSTEGAIGDSDNAMKACAFNLKGALGCVVRDCTIDDCGGGVYVGRTQNCLLDNLTISGCDAFGVLDYRAAALRINGGDIQISCLDGTNLTVGGFSIPCANIVSFEGSGTVVSGTKTKNASANAQVYCEEGFGIVLEKLWVQTTMQVSVPHRAILLHECTAAAVIGCTISMTNSGFTEDHTGIEVTNNTNTPTCIRIIGNQFQYPPLRTVRALIAIVGNAAARLMSSIIIEGNTGGSRAGLSGACGVLDGILVTTCTLTASRIQNNTFHAAGNVTYTNGIRFLTVTDGGKNWIADNNFVVSGTGVITEHYDGLTESELVGSATWNPLNLANGASESLVLTVTGAALGDIVLGAGFTADHKGCVLSWLPVQVADQVTLTFTNNTGSAQDIASGVATAFVRKRTFS